MAADLVGVNMEGPFISEEKKGAQDVSFTSMEMNINQTRERITALPVKYRIIPSDPIRRWAYRLNPPVLNGNLTLHAAQ